MTIERDKIEQEFLEQAQKSIKKLLDELPQTGRISLSDMERVTGRMGQDMMQHALQSLAHIEQPPTPEEIGCKNCNRRMSSRGKRKKKVVTLRGEVEVERDYYVCPQCHKGVFPPQ